MKKIIIAICLSFCVQTTFAQLEKGMFAVGISSNVSKYVNTNENNTPTSSNSFTSKMTMYSILPTVNYFISNKYSIGLQLGYSGSTNNSNYSGSDTTYSSFSKGSTKETSGGITFSPNIKYYIPLNENIYFFIKGSVSTYIGNGQNRYSNQGSYYNSYYGGMQYYNSESGPNKTKTIDMSIGISPGVLFMPSKKIGIEFSLGNILSYNSHVVKLTRNNSNSISKESTNGLAFLSFNSFYVGTSLYYFF